MATTLEKPENRRNEAVLADGLHKEQIVLDEIVSQRGSTSSVTDGAKTKLRHEEIGTVRGYQ